jgi:hypothetical protein
MSKDLRESIDKFRNFLIKENDSNIEVPKYLYHATYRPLLKKIKLEGLGGPSSKPQWEDSKKGVVYLALDSEVAYSYAETAFDENEDLPEEWYEKIIVLKINTENLDKSKFFLDKNVLDNDGSTVEYYGVIPFESVVKVIKYDD